MTDFLARATHLPRLGVGVSTEYGAGDAPGSLEVLALHDRRPELAAFLEVGVETAKGLDGHARAWRARGLPATYHFLDVNLDEPEDLDPRWLDEVRGCIAELEPAWLCGDAGMWHFGPRERGHMLLLPPILSEESTRAMADGIVALREATGLEVLPENPPGNLFLGDLHILDYFARVAELADTGLLLDVAHLAMYQRATGHAPLDGLDGFPVERIVEMHVAGGREETHDGFAFIEDEHGPDVLHDTWAAFDWLAPRARNLKAVVVECERNPIAACLPLLERVAGTVEMAA